MFFHKFFSQKNEKERAKAAKVDKRKDHDDDTTSSSDRALDGREYELQESDGEAPDAEINVPEEAEENSDTDEAEIWKVRHFPHFQNPSLQSCMCT